MTDATAQFKDYHLPSSVDWWPLAPGWWILAALLIALALYALLLLQKRNTLRRQQAYRREALTKLSQHWQGYQTDNNSQHFAMAANQLLKQVALTVFERREIASLNDAQWIEFLNQSSSSGEGIVVFTAELADMLTILPYAPPRSARGSNLEALYIACKNWLNHHRVKAPVVVSPNQQVEL